MKIVVTGGAGFIGSHVVDAYILAGHQVIVIDDLSSGSQANLNPQAKFYKADITDLAEVTKIFVQEKPEIVNHHAAQVSVIESQKDPLRTEAINFQGTINLIGQPGIKHFIFASTGGAMYSDSTLLPASEKTPAVPISNYGKSKLLAEQAIVEYSTSKGFSYVILRYANVFGPRQNAQSEGGVVAIFCDLAVRGGQPTIYGQETTRDYVYVGDVAAANVLALKKGQGIYNIATGVETTNQQVFEIISRIFNWKAAPAYAQLRPGELRRSVLDAAKVRRELGWQPEINFEQGVVAIYNHLHAGKN